MEEINQYAQCTGSELNAIKVILADEATRMLHGEECLGVIHQTVASLYSSSTGSNSSGSNSSGSSSLDSLQHIELELSDFTINHDSVSTTTTPTSSISIIDLLIKVNFVTSKNAAKRLINMGGVRLNDEKVTDETAELSLDHLNTIGKVKLSSGKKKHIVVVPPTMEL